MCFCLFMKDPCRCLMNVHMTPLPDNSSYSSWHLVLDWFPAAVINTMTSNLGRKRFMLYYRLQSTMRGVKAGMQGSSRSWTRGNEGVLLHPFLDLLETPAKQKPHSGLSPPTMIVNQGNASTDLTVGHSKGGIFSTEIFIFVDDTSLWQGDRNINQHTFQAITKINISGKPHKMRTRTVWGPPLIPTIL